MSFQKEAEALEYLETWLKQRPAIEGANLRFISNQAIVLLLISEIIELEEALESPLPKQIAYEFVDVFIVASMFFLRYDFAPDGHQPISPISSPEQLKSSVLAMKSVAAEIEVGGVSQPLLQKFFVLWKGLEKYILADQQLRSVFKQKLEINGWNRPAEYYQPSDQEGKPLTDEEMYEKYTHSEVCLRMIRKHFERLNQGKPTPLHEWMHHPFREYILNFRQLESAQAALEVALKQSWRFFQQMLDSVTRQVKEGIQVSAEDYQLLYLAAQPPEVSEPPNPQLTVVETRS